MFHGHVWLYMNVHCWFNWKCIEKVECMILYLYMGRICFWFLVFCFRFWIFGRKVVGVGSRVQKLGCQRNQGPDRAEKDLPGRARKARLGRESNRFKRIAMLLSNISNFSKPPI